MGYCMIVRARDLPVAIEGLKKRTVKDMFGIRRRIEKPTRFLLDTSEYVLCISLITGKADQNLKVLAISSCFVGMSEN